MRLQKKRIMSAEASETPAPDAPVAAVESAAPHPEEEKKDGPPPKPVVFPPPTWVDAQHRYNTAFLFSSRLHTHRVVWYIYRRALSHPQIDSTHQNV